MRWVKTPQDGRRLGWILGLAALALGGAFAFRAIGRRAARQRAIQEAQAALDRDTYGGFRDVDLALREFVRPGDSLPALAAERAYALAQLASRYGEEQDGAEAELLLLPLERRATALLRVPLARALLLLGRREPGSALLAIGGAPDGTISAELFVGEARIQAALDRPDLARRSMEAARRNDPTLLEVLRTSGDLARAGLRYREAEDDYRAALARSPRHIPSLLGLGELAAEGRVADPQGVADDLDRSLTALPTEGSPEEQCRVLLALVRLDLQLGHALGAPNHLDRAAELSNAPASCQLDLARIDRRLGRTGPALALIQKAAAADEPGAAPLALAEALDDPRAALDWAERPPPPALTPEQRDDWTARARAIEVRAYLGLGDVRAATGRAAALQDVETVSARLALARLRHAAGALRGLASAERLAREGAVPADDLAEVGEVALALGAPQVALEACDLAAASSRDNCRALLCSARALVAKGRLDAARQRLDQALGVNPSAEGAAALRTALAPPPAAARPSP